MTLANNWNSEVYGRLKLKRKRSPAAGLKQQCIVSRQTDKQQDRQTDMQIYDWSVWSVCVQSVVNIRCSLDWTGHPDPRPTDWRTDLVAGHRVLAVTSAYPDLTVFSGTLTSDEILTSWCFVPFFFGIFFAFDLIVFNVWFFVGFRLCARCF